MKVLLTGAAGFVGRAALKRLANETRFAPRAALRRDVDAIPAGVERVLVAGCAANTSWAEALAGCDAVVHAAARVHVMLESPADPLAEFRKVNVEGSLNLARQSAAAGARRFVFLSSIKVNGEQTAPDHMFTPDDRPQPQDAYATSKHEAELGLRRIAGETGMEVVVIRPPLVYGPGVKANFAALLRAVGRGVPLPLGAIDNLRSLIALDNLVDFISHCLRHPAAANQTFTISDGEDLSTPELVRRMARALGRSTRLIPVPPSLLLAGAALVGKRAAAERLCGNLQIDNRKARELLGWHPPIDVDEGLRRAVGGMGAG